MEFADKKQKLKEQRETADRFHAFTKSPSREQMGRRLGFY